MGAARKIETFSRGDKVKHPSDTDASVRNLRKKDLGAVIFSCTNSTMKECLQAQLFGLPASDISYVQNIRPGLPLFLFNYTDKKLHGIFEAASEGRLNINPYGWTADGSERTLFPAQVRIRVRKHCQSLLEAQYQQIIVDNYYGQDNHFWFELDHAQTGALMSLFESFPVKTVVSCKAPVTRTRLEPCLNDGMESEEERIFLKLKQIAMKRESLNISEKDCKEESHVPCRTSETHLEDKFFPAAPSQDDCSPAASSVPENWEDLVMDSDSQSTLERESSNTVVKDHSDRASVPGKMSETDLEDDCSPAAPSEDDFSAAAPSAIENRIHSTIDHNYQSEVNQLRLAVSDLKAFCMEESRKISALETKLACSDGEIQRIKEQVKMMQSQLEDSLTACVGESSKLHGDSLMGPCDESSKLHGDSLMGPCDESSLGMKEKLIYIIGGCAGDGSWLSTVDCYSTCRDIVTCLTPMSSTRSYSSAAVSDGYIFNIGGCGDLSGSSWYDTVECYDPYNNMWISCPPLSERKGCLASTTWQNNIFVFGGGNGVDCSSRVEMFDPALGRWILMQSMLEKRFAAAAAELNNVLYVVGGYYDGTYSKSAERFDPREVSSSRLRSMNTSRGSHSLAVLNEKLYALGGFDGDRVVSSVEMFDPRMGSWVMDDEMKEPRGYCFAPVIDGKIYTIGGLKEHGTFADTVECYKEGSGWSVTNLKGIGTKSFFSAVLV